MKKQSRFEGTFTHLLLVAMLGFTCCTSSPDARQDGDLYSGLETEGSEEAKASGGDDLTELTGSTDSSASDLAASSPSKEAEAPKEVAADMPSDPALEIPTESKSDQTALNDEVKPTLTEEATPPPLADDNTGLTASMETQNQTPPSSEDSTPPPPTDDTVAATPSSDLPASSEMPGSSDLPAAGGGSSDLASFSATPEGGASPDSQGEKSAAKPKATRSIASTINRMPKVAAKPVEKDGKMLNRFYFLRASDSAQTVSKLIYGNDSRSSELNQWNPGPWKAGRVVYYESPVQPTASDMISFYKESGENPAEYTVKEGDQLSSIAREKFGDTSSWKEIAMTNDLSNPDKIEPGQTITLYPSQLSGYKEAAAVAVADASAAPSATPTPAEPTKGPAEVTPAGSLPVQPAVAVAEDEPDDDDDSSVRPATPRPAGKGRPDLASLEVGKPSAATGDMPIYIGGGIVAMVALFFLVRKLRRRRDFIE